MHNPVTGEKDLVPLPGSVAIAYQHETISTAQKRSQWLSTRC
jgi:hypothetical protein